MKEVLIPAIVFFSFVYIIKAFFDYRLRRLLIEKGMVDENIKYLYSKQSSPQPLASLKWGMVLIGLGLALLLYALFPDEISEQTTFGFMFLFAGIGFMIYYFIANKLLKRLAE